MRFRPPASAIGHLRWSCYEAARRLWEVENTIGKNTGLTPSEAELLEGVRQSADRCFEALLKAEEKEARTPEVVRIAPRKAGAEWQLFAVPTKGRPCSPADPVWGVESVREIFLTTDGEPPSHYPLCCGLYGEDAEAVVKALNQSRIRPESILEQWAPNSISGSAS